LKVSIITAVFNGSETIEDCIKSIHTQTHPDIEHIIIDGGSTDGTIEIIKNHKDKISRFISEKDNGLYDAMNKGIRLAKGDLIGFLNADDIYYNEDVISQATALVQKDCLQALYGDLIYIDRMNPNKVVRYWRPGRYKAGAFYSGWVPPHPTFFCRKEIFERFGYFNDKLKIAADFELMLRFIEKNKIKVGYLPKIIVKMRTGGKANVIRGIMKGNSEIIKSFRLNGLHISAKFFVQKPITKINQLFKKVKALQ